MPSRPSCLARKDWWVKHSHPWAMEELLMNYALLLFLQLLFEKLHHKIRSDSDVKKFVPGHEWATVILVTFIETLSCYALPKCWSMYHPFENKRESQHWGKREEVCTGISWLTRRDMRNLPFQPNVQRNLVSIVVFISMLASLEKSAESSLREQLCHLQVNTSLTSGSLAKK